MKKLFAINIIFFFALSAFGVTQKGIVRSISRPDKQGELLAGAIVRIRGSHNAVETNEKGEFSIILPNKQNGDAFALSSVILSGYELADKELIGRQMACSENVSIEILMVNKNELQKEKELIAQKARQNVEIYYEQRIQEFEKQLANGQIQQEEFQKKVDELEGKYEQFEPLLELMADKYARTDISKLSELDIKINNAIENGNLDEAQGLIRSKGDFAQRENDLRTQQLQNLAVRQQLETMQQKLEEEEKRTQEIKNSIANDYYNLYSIHLSRFTNDSAAYYICRRAELDTTNAQYQKQAGQFLKNIMGQYQKALDYYQRAQRHASENSEQMFTVLGEIGQTYLYLKDFSSANNYFSKALSIAENIQTNTPENKAEIYNSISQLYYFQDDYKQAQQYQTKALDIFIKKYGNSHKRVAAAHSNLGAIYLKQNKLKAAQQEFKAAIDIEEAINKNPSKNLAAYYNNYASLCLYQNELEEAEKHFQKAFDMYLLILGKDNNTTLTVFENLQIAKKKQGKPYKKNIND
ncbi:MAG: tetratricopeptide repeat protein [Paludibacteraceae bacterium]|nr:tetratricopeptide repeat protein [Paludibacteraceae bacterium]